MRRLFRCKTPNHSTQLIKELQQPTDRAGWWFSGLPGIFVPRRVCACRVQLIRCGSTARRVCGVTSTVRSVLSAKKDGAVPGLGVLGSTTSKHNRQLMRTRLFLTLLLLTHTFRSHPPYRGPGQGPTALETFPICYSSGSVEQRRGLPD